MEDRSGTQRGLTVCIPTHTGRSAMTAELLDTVVEAARDLAEPLEIVVVDDSTGREATAVVRKCDEVGARYLRGHKSVGLKRNLAAREARHDLLLFVDSDCLVTDATLRLHLEALRNAQEDVAGIVGLTEMHGEVTRVWRQIEGTQFHNPCFDFPDRYTEVGWGTTANLSVRRDVLIEVGGFATGSFTLVGGEDVDFGLRVTKSGYRWVTNRDAVVLHRRSPIKSLDHVFGRLFTYGRADVFLMDQHPERADPHLNPYTLGLVALLAGIVAGRTKRRIGAAAAIAVPLVTLTGEAIRRARSNRTLYGDRAIGDSANRRRILHHLKGAVIDSSFDAGLAWEALRRGKLGRAFTRFTYVDDETFSAREQQ